MGKIMKNGIEYSASSNSAENISYDGTKNVKEAIDDVNSSLKSKVGNFTSGNYKAVTGLAYDATNKKLGLKVGADTVIPFSSKHDFILDSSETLISTYTTQKDGYYCVNSINYSSGHQNEIKIDGVIHSLNFVFNAGGEFIANGIYYLKSGVTIIPYNSNYISVLYYGE